MPPLPTRRRLHWTVVASCLTVVSLTTAVVVMTGSGSASVASSKNLVDDGGNGAALGTTPVAGASADGVGAAGASAGGSGSPSAGPSAVHVASRKLYFGLAYGNTLLSKSGPALNTSLDEAVSLGVAYIRIDLPWSTIQPNNSRQYDWRAYDRIVQGANARKLKIDATIDSVPRWARKNSCASIFTCPPASPTAFADFAAAAAQRYASQGVHTWEIWNEPNMGAWWAPIPDPAGYETLLATTAKTLRHADPNAFVVMGGLAAVPTSTARNFLSAHDFLLGVARLGGNHYVNAVAFHPYSLPQMPSQSANFAEISSTPDGNLVGVLQKYGTPNVPIWLTETGATVGLAHVDASAQTPASKLAEQVQAQYAVDLVATVTANPNVAADFWYSDQDDTKSLTFFGLRRVDGSDRPSFDALKNTLASCGCNLTQ